MHRNRLHFSLCLALAALLGTSRLAAQATWLGTASTDWSNPANWSPASVPNSSTDASITGINPAIISGDASAGTFRVGDPGTATLTVNAGTFSTGLVLLGNDNPNYAANVTVTGGSTIWDAGSSDYFVGDYGTVTLNVSGAATINAANLDVAWNSSAHSTMVIDHATVNTSGFADIANQGTGRVTVQNGGQLNATNGIRVGNYSSGAGTLVAAGNFGGSSSLGSSAVLVGPHGTFAGNDFITGAVSVSSGGHLAPGDGVALTTGVLRFDGGLTLNSGAVLDFALSGSAPTFLTMGTGATLTGPGSGTVTVNITDFGDFTANTYKLLDWSAGSATGLNLGAGNFALGSTISGYNFNLAINGTELDLTATAIPEPATYAAALASAALLVAAYHRRKRPVPGARN